MKYIATLATATSALAASLYPATAQQPPLGQCPAGASSCIVVTMTPDEVRSLTAPGGMFDQAEWANRSGMSGIVGAWKQKLSTSPQGTVPLDPKKDETPKQ